MSSSRSPSSTPSDVGGLELRAVVVDLLVREQHVAADLRAPLDLQPRLRVLGGLRLALGELVVVHLAAQHLHRLGLVRVLAALVLALDDDAGRQVRDAHRRVGLVDVLTACPAGAVRVDLEIFLVDVDFDVVVDVGGHLHGGGTTSALRPFASNGDTRTSRCTPFSALSKPYAYSPPTSRVACLMPASSASGLLEQVDLPALALAVARDHAQQHVRPVARVDAASA